MHWMMTMMMMMIYGIVRHKCHFVTWRKCLGSQFFCILQAVRAASLLVLIMLSKMNYGGAIYAVLSCFDNTVGWSS